MFLVNKGDTMDSIIDNEDRQFFIDLVFRRVQTTFSLIQPQTQRAAIDKLPAFITMTSMWWCWPTGPRRLVVCSNLWSLI